MIRRLWDVTPLVAFIILAVYESVNALTASRRVAGDDDWSAAAAEVRAGYQRGDLIVFAPSWSDQVGRHWLGDLVTVEMASRADDDRYSRVWEVSIRGAESRDRVGAHLIHANDHGRVRVSLFQKATPVIVTEDFTSHLEDARITQAPSDGRGNETPCYRDADGFRCHGTHVERRTLEVDYQPRRGILAPVDGTLTTRIEYSEVDLGSRLIGYTALHDYFSRKNADGPVDFAVFIDNERVLSIKHKNDDGWRRFTIDTARFAGAKHVVRFEVRADSSAWRTFGFHAEARQ